MNLVFSFRVILLIILPFVKLVGQCDNDFVRIDGKKFKCSGGTNFYPVVVNYVTEICHLHGNSTNTFPNQFPSRFHPYFPTNTQAPTVTSQASAFNVLVKDFTDMKGKGFNTVRIVGATEYGRQCSVWNNCANTTTNAAIYSLDTIGTEPLLFDVQTNTQLLLDITQNILDAATQANIKVILLVNKDPASVASPSTTYSSGFINYLTLLASKFKNNPTLLAIDLFNEPGIPSLYNNSKTLVCNVTKLWSNAIKNNSQILTTIGFNGVDNVFSWDPNIANVDFASFHNYPVIKDTINCSDLLSAVDRIKSDYFWFTNNLSIPWIVGETGLDANINQTSHPLNHALINKNPCGDLSDQSDYLGKTLSACRDYGGAGYSWWTFMEEAGGPYWGLAAQNDGKTTSSISWKPGASNIYSFNPTPIPANFIQPSNYFNYFGYNLGFKAIGTIKDLNTNLPIKDAVLIALGPTYNRLGLTYTDASGNFTLNATNTIKQMEVSAVDCDVYIDWSLQNNTSSVLSGLSYSLTKITRPNTTSINYASQNIYNANVTDYALNDINFSNYQIFSGNFNSTAGSIIHLNTGFSAKSGSNFNARIGKYYQNCGSLVNAGGAFRQVQNVKNDAVTFGSITIYPNPGNGLYKVNTEQDGQYYLEVYNLLGIKLKSLAINNTNLEIDIREYIPGMYIFALTDKAKTTCNIFKIIKD